MSAPIAPAPVLAPAPVAPAAVAPIAAAPVAAVPTAPPTAPVGLPAGYGGIGAPPAIGSIPSGTGGGIPEEHFNKPILFRLLSVGPRSSKYEKVEVLAPTVDYIVVDPATAQFTEVKNATIMQKNIRNELVTCFQRGEQAVTAVATLVPTSNDNDAKVLRALDDSNSGWGPEVTVGYLRDAAIHQFGWWKAAA